MTSGKILVTGATGFIGSHLCELLATKGYDVVAFDRYNSFNDYGWLDTSPYRDEFEIVLGDIRDYDSVYSSMRGCKAVLHLAALIGIPYSYVSPLAYLKTNIEGTYNVLEAGRKLDLEEILVTSTSESYGTAQFVPITEDHPLVGQSPYSVSKIAAEQLAVSYFRSFQTPVKIVRPFNTYGPRQSSRAVIPTIISQILAGTTEVKLGNTSPTRDLTFVADTCNAIVQVYTTQGLYGQPINIGTNSEISIAELAEKIASIMNIQIEVIGDPIRTRPTNSEVERLRCDNSKLLGCTHWTPNYGLEQGLRETINWIQENGTAQISKHNIYHV